VKVFLDTNVLVSAFGTRGVCTDVLQRVLDEHQLVTGEIVLEELRSVLRRKFAVSAERVSRVERFLRQYQIEPRPQSLPDLKLKERNDLLVVASAINAGAEVMITGDAEILQLKNAGIRFLSPRDFWMLTSPKNKSH